MGNTFSVKIKKNGDFVDITGTAVFPFSFGDLLDERLDEAYLRLVKDTTPYYEPLTEFEITIKYGALINSPLYFVVASDTPVNFPVGSEYYKHEIYLIERTKLLEGVLCPSVTFTNSKSTDYGIYKNAALATNYAPNESINFVAYDGITTPEKQGEAVKVPSALSVGTAYVNVYNAQTNSSYYPVDGYTKNGKEHRTNVNIYLDDVLYATVPARDSYTIVGVVTQNVNYITYIYNLCFQKINVGTNGSISTSEFDSKVSFKIALYKNEYALPPYTITDCVNRVLSLANPLIGAEKPKYTFDGVVYTDNGDIWYYNENSQAEYYNDILAPEFTMTECTLREQLKIIGGFIHAEPYLDENNVVHFLDYGKTKRSTVTNLPHVYKSYNVDINQYCTEVRSNAQNLVNSMGYASGVVVDPCNNLARNIRSETENVRISESNGVIETSFPIYEVQKLECQLLPVGSEDRSTFFDITPYVFEETEYKNNLSSYSEGYPYSKSYAVYYTIGSKNIKGLFFKPENAINTSVLSHYAIANIYSSVSGESLDAVYNELVVNPYRIVFKVTYKPIVQNTLISHAKPYYTPTSKPFVQISNQSGNLIESNNYGENLKGIAARLGNVEQTRTYIFPGISSTINTPNVGEIIDGYAVSAVNMELMPNCAKCTVALSKDFNRISQYVGVSSVKRLYQVAERNTYRRSILYKETLLVGEYPGANGYNKTAFIDLVGFLALFRPVLIDSSTAPPIDAKISGVIASTYDKSNGTAPALRKKVILPVVPFALGNALSLSFSYKDNYAAGNRAIRVDSNGVIGMWQQGVSYVDFFGRAYWLGFKFFSKAKYDQGLSTVIELPEYPTSPVFEPISDIYINNEYTSDVYPGAPYNRLLRLDKDNREEISVTYECEAQSTDEHLIIGSGLIQACRYLKTPNSIETGLELWLVRNGVYKFDEQFVPEGNLDTRLDQDYGSTGTLYYRTEEETDGTNTHSKYVYFSIPTKKVSDVTGTYEGWVLCTPRDSYKIEVEEYGVIKTVEIERGRKIVLAYDASDNPIKKGDTICCTTNGNPIYFYIKKEEGE